MNKFLLPVIIAVIAGVGIYYVSHSSKPNIKTDQESFWRQEIKKLGGKEAYQELGQKLQGVSLTKQHTTAHVFGGALYLEEGINSLSVCDSQFRLGCFHEFMGRAIAEQGLQVVGQLTDECKQAAGDKADNCRHSLGHGILSWFGYDEANLTEALKTCVSTQTESGYDFCPSGVFMEYENRSLADNDLRLPPEGNYFDPCDHVTLFQERCVLWLPLWWKNLLERNTTDETKVFTTLADRCRELEGKQQTVCFYGIGRETLNVSQPSAQNSFDICRAVSLSDDQLFACAAYAAARFKDEYSVVEQKEADVLCNKLSSSSDCRVFNKEKSLQ